jgi:hypothetical protein
MSDNCEDHDYRLYEIDRDNPQGFDETRFAKHFMKQEGRFTCFTVLQRAIEGTECCRSGEHR